MKAGFVALIGSPNVGKSTLLNHYVGQKISITSRRPQTTRHRILGIKSTQQAQIVFVDTPGMHRVEKRALNRYLNRTAITSLLDVNAAIWIKDKPIWHDYDEVIIGRLKDAGIPVIFAVNKIDRFDDKQMLLPLMDRARSQFEFVSLIPISALKGTNLDLLEKTIIDVLPTAQAIFPEDQITDRSERFLIAELIREKLVRRLCQELPHSLTVEIEKFENKGPIIRIDALVLVERVGQKSIVIGNKGQNLKIVGYQARKDMEVLLGHKVFLNLWVKVKKGWADSERSLQSLGYLG